MTLVKFWAKNNLVFSNYKTLVFFRGSANFNWTKEIPHYQEKVASWIWHNQGPLHKMAYKKEFLNTGKKVTSPDKDTQNQAWVET